MNNYYYGIYIYIFLNIRRVNKFDVYRFNNFL